MVVCVIAFMHGSRTYLDEINSRVGFKRGVAQESAVNFAQAAEYYDVLARPFALHVFIFLDLFGSTGVLPSYTWTVQRDPRLWTSVTGCTSTSL